MDLLKNVIKLITRVLKRALAKKTIECPTPFSFTEEEAAEGLTAFSSCEVTAAKFPDISK